MDDPSTMVCFVSQNCINMPFMMTSVGMSLSLSMGLPQVIFFA